MKRLVVNNALSRDVSRLFGDKVVNRVVLEKNKIEIIINVSDYDSLFKFFIKSHNLYNRVSDC